MTSAFVSNIGWIVLGMFAKYVEVKENLATKRSLWVVILIISKLTVKTKRCD